MLQNKFVKIGLTILLIMIGIFAVKKLAGKYNIPVVSKVAEGV
jgi:hypothetical protein